VPDPGIEKAALVLIDVQRGFDDPVWGTRNNPACEANVATLLAHWRERGRPVVFVRHDSSEPGSPLAGGSAGNDFKDVITGEPELLVVKSTNSAFYGEPDLDRWLRQSGIDTLVIAGITTNHCCETTARMAGNLGYETFFALDATHTFERRAPSGRIIGADELSAVTAANLDGEFATVVSTEDLLR